jgi:hypothetical protein
MNYLKFRIMKNLILILSMLVIVLACKEETPSAFYLNTNFNFYIEDINGEDLLSYSHPNGINREDIKVYYMVDGTYELVLPNDRSYANGYSIIAPSQLSDSKGKTHHTFRLATNAVNLVDDKSLTLISWGNDDADTVMTQYSISGNSKALNKISFNGGELLSGAELIDFTIVK